MNTAQLGPLAWLAAALGVLVPQPWTLRSLYGLAPPPALRAPHTALVLVDFQREFLDGRLPLRHAPEAVAHAARLVEWARASGILVVHVRNVITRPGSPLFAAGSATADFIPPVSPRPGDLVVTKATGGAFTGTELDAQLRQRSIDTVVVGGLMTHLAVAITATDATVLGYRTVVAAEATATRSLPGANGAAAIDEAALQRAALATLSDRAADVLGTTALLRLPIER